ncbi:MAG: carbohydrate ABC transporter permease [Eubacteriales bacterium]|nr:carbohydrate ABC transporter permease [Eubacteriales bacterium]
MKKSTKMRLTKLLIEIGLLIGLVYALFPVVWMISCAFKSNKEVFTVPQQIIPRNITLEAFTSVLTDTTKLRYFVNSYIVALVTTGITLIVAIMAGYALSRYDFKAKKTLNTFIIITQAVPPITLLIPYFGMLVMFGLYDSYWAMIVTYLVFTLPYATIMITGYINTLPKDLDEAVAIDGGSTWCVLWRVLVPIAKPGLVATAIYTFLQCWNEYLFALCLTKSGEMRTVPIGIQLLMGQITYSWNEMMAMSILGSIPIIILFVFAQNYFIAGLSAGAIKS